MKLLLTSGGITNKSIADALFSLTEKNPDHTTKVSDVTTIMSINNL